MSAALSPSDQAVEAAARAIYVAWCKRAFTPSDPVPPWENAGTHCQAMHRDEARAAITAYTAARAAETADVERDLRELLEEVIDTAGQYDPKQFMELPHALAERGWFKRAAAALARAETPSKGGWNG